MNIHLMLILSLESILRSGVSSAANTAFKLKAPWSLLTNKLWLPVHFQILFIKYNYN